MKIIQLLILSFMLVVMEGVSESPQISVLAGPKTVKEQIKLGYDVNAQDDFGHTPLMEAAYWNEIEVTRLLLEAGADVNIQDKYGSTALIEAAGYGRLEIVKRLLIAGANINVLDNLKFNPLHSAAVNGHIEVVEYLIKKGIDINNIDIRGQSVLHSVRNSYRPIPNHKIVAEIIVRNGAVDVWSERGKKMTTEELLNVLRRGGPSVNAGKSNSTNANCLEKLAFKPTIRSDSASCTKENLDNPTR